MNQAGQVLHFRAHNQFRDNFMTQTGSMRIFLSLSIWAVGKVVFFLWISVWENLQDGGILSSMVEQN